MPHTFPFTRYKWLYFAISLLIILPGLISLVVFGLNPSIDFTGGSLMEITARQPLSSQDIISHSRTAGVEIISVQDSGNNVYVLRSKQIDQAHNDQLISALNTELSGVFQTRFESVGPVVGEELARKSLLAVVIASFCIIGYIAWSFRNVPRPYTSWKFGVSAVIALLHDALVVLGLFSLLGHFFHVEIDALFVTAVLTVIGFSVHDTIVVFDRIRENLPKLPQASFSQVVDFSLTETVVRSLNTSLTVTLILIALLLFGGESIRWFVVALLVGIVSGTFSSIFNAAQILVLWEEQRPNRK